MIQILSIIISHIHMIAFLSVTLWTKLKTYVFFKTLFVFKIFFLDLKDFRMRQPICTIRISAQSLGIETDRYTKMLVKIEHL